MSDPRSLPPPMVMDTHQYTCHNAECTENDVDKIGPDMEGDVFCGTCGDPTTKTENPNKQE